VRENRTVLMKLVEEDDDDDDGVEGNYKVKEKCPFTCVQERMGEKERKKGLFLSLPPALVILCVLVTLATW